MSEVPEGRCGYTWPDDVPDDELPFGSTVHESCCWRKTLPDANKCAWHADPEETEHKTVEQLQQARAPAKVREQTKPAGELLDGAELSGIDLRDSISFSRTALRNADLSEAWLLQADLSEAELRKADLSEAWLLQANLSEAKLRKADLSGADLYTAYLLEAELREANLSETELPGANLSKAKLWRANLPGAILVGANLSEAELSANLSEANLRAAILTGAGISHTELEKIRIDGATTFGGKSRFEALADQRSLSNIPFSRWQPSFLRALGRVQTDPDLLVESERQYRATQRKLRENNFRELPELDIQEKHARRKRALAEQNYWLWLKRAFSRWVLGYGERIRNVIGTSAVIMVVFGWLYSVVGGVEVAQEQLPTSSLADAPTFSVSVPQWAGTLWDNLYFSIVTFSTLGYGDIQPANRFTQALASVESLIGALLIAYLVFVLGRRTVR